MAHCAAGLSVLVLVLVLPLGPSCTLFLDHQLDDCSLGTAAAAAELMGIRAEPQSHFRPTPKVGRRPRVSQRV